MPFLNAKSKPQPATNHHLTGVSNTVCFFYSSWSTVNRRVRLKSGFYFRIRSCLCLEARKILVPATFMSVIDYGVIYMYASAPSLKSSCCMHVCSCWLKHWHLLIYKCILGQLLPLLSLCLLSGGSNSLCSHNMFKLSVAKVRSEEGFLFFCPHCMESPTERFKIELASVPLKGF